LLAPFLNTIIRYHKLIFIFLCIFSGKAFAQQNAVVYGKVTDKNGKPLEDITVSLFGRSNTPVFTNKEGEFEYTVPAEEDIIIVLSGINFSTEKIRLNLKPEEKLLVNRQLKEAARTILDSVVIEDKLRTTSMIRLDPKIVSFIPSASGDFNSILFSQLGVSNRNELSSQYSVRGGNFDENLVYVNDIEVYRPFLVRSGQQEGLSFINSEMVSSVLFSAGGFEAKYGDKMSSVLDVQYRRPRKFNGSIQGGLQGSNIHLEGASKDFRFTWIMGARYKTQRRVLGTSDEQGDYRPWFADLQTFLTYDISDVWELNVLGNYARNKYIVVPQTRETEFGTINKALQLKVYFDGAEIDDFETYTGAASFNYHPNGRLSMKFITSTFRTFENESFDIQGQYYIDELERDIGKKNFGQSVATLGVGTFLNHARNNLNATVYNFEHKGANQINKKQRILWGVRYQTEIINDKLSEWKMIDSAGYSLPQGNPGVIELLEVVKTKEKLSSGRVMGYTQYVFNKELKDTSELTFTVGVRANYWDLNGQTVVSPRATLAYKPNWKRDFLFKASGGYYCQPPFYRELRNLYGEVNTNVKAQQSIHFLLSSDYNFRAWRRPFKFITEAYYKSLSSIIPYEVDNVRIRYYAENSARGYATGIDMKVNGEFVKGIESWASLSIMQTKEDILNDYYYDYYNKSGEKIVSGYTLDTQRADSIRHEPGSIPRPTDQRVSFSIFFQDYLPRFPDFKMHLNLLFGTSIPFGPPDFAKYRDTLKMPPYRRVDIGFSYQVIKEEKPLSKHNPFHNFKSVWISMEVFNLLDVNNTVSYLWIKDISNRSYAIPNYLTGRILNIRTIARF